MVCEDCGKDDETVIETLCPYAMDVNDIERWIVACGDCVYERAMDI